MNATDGMRSLDCGCTARGNMVISPCQEHAQDIAKALCLEAYERRIAAPQREREARRRELGRIYNDFVRRAALAIVPGVLAEKSFDEEPWYRRTRMLAERLAEEMWRKSYFHEVGDDPEWFKQGGRWEAEADARDEAARAFAATTQGLRETLCECGHPARLHGASRRDATPEERTGCTGTVRVLGEGQTSAPYAGCPCRQFRGAR
jgi:hypothetical protein